MRIQIIGASFRSNLVADFRPKRETAQLLVKSKQTILMTGIISAFRNRAALAC
jgi:hypothetical protein